MSKRSRQPPGRSEPYGYSSVPAPAPASAAISEFQGPVQQDIIDTTEQWTYDNNYDDPNFGYIAPLPEANLGSQHGSDTWLASRDPNSLERSSEKEESLLDLLDGSHTLEQPAQINKKPNPRQLPEALKYLAPVPAQRNISHQSDNPQSRLAQQPLHDELLPLLHSPPDSHYPHQQFQNAQPISHQPSATYSITLADVNDPFLYGNIDGFSKPLEIAIGPMPPTSLSKGKRKQSFSPSPSPEPHLSRPRRTAKAKRRRENNRPSSSSSPQAPFGSEWWESDASLCWRCRKRNANHLISGFCDSCIRVSNFNVAPSTQGTRRENLESLVLYLLPSHMEENLRAIPRDTLKTKTWRMFSAERAEKAFDHDFNNAVFRDHFVLAQEQARSTGVFDEKYSDLISIAQTYQESILQPALALAPSDFRSRRDWLPSFLSACSLAISAVVFIDMMVAIPSPYKERIWGVKWQDTITEIRHGGYGMMLEVLRANTKNVNPLELSCWNQDFGIDTSLQTEYALDPSHSQFSYGLPSPTQDFTQDDLCTNMNYDQSCYNYWQRMQIKMQQQAKAEEERRILLGDNSPEALQGMMAVKLWQIQNYDHLKLGEDIFKKDLYRQATINPIAGLWRIFDMK